MNFLKNIPATDDDAALIEKYKRSGDLEILSVLYQRYMELVYGVSLKYLADTEDAKDCVLNIFEELVTKLKRHDVDNFKGWLYQLTKNHCLMLLRKKKKAPVNIDISLMQSGENLHPEDGVQDSFIEKEENFKHMQFCLEQLVDQQRLAVELFYLQNKCYKEIAEATNMEVNTVRSFIQNGRRNLKICMDKKARRG